MKSIAITLKRDRIYLRMAFSLLFVLLSAPFFAQNYFELKHKTEQYLENLHKTMPDSLFYHEGSEHSKFKQWVEFWEPRMLQDGDFQSYYERQRDGYELLESRSFNTYNANWQEIGPTDEPAGVIGCNVTQSAGIGPVEFIRFYNPNPQHMLTGSTKGGLFYSSNGGDQWVNAGSDHWSGVSTVSWAVFKADDPEVAFAASGEPDDNHAGQIQWTGGVYRARKNGTINPNTQWDLIASVYNCFNGQTNCRINKLLADPYDPNVLYVASSCGLFKSSNVNAVTPTWQNILPDNIWDIEMRPGAGNHLTLYVSFDGNPNLPNPSPNSNLVKYSTNGGNTWLLLPNSPSSLAVNSSASNIRSVNIEVSESVGFQQNIYLFYYGTSATAKNVYRYNFSNQSFVNIIANVDDLSLGSFVNCCFGAGSAFGVSQSGTNEVIFLAYGDRYARWINGTLTFFGYTNPNVNEYHVDVEGFTLNPNNANEVWMASHGGPYKSINQGANWAPKMKGVGVAMVFNMATSYENPEDILISTYHDGCILTQGAYTNNWNPSWKYVFGCDGANVAIDNKDPNYMYASGQGNGWGRSTDGGATPFSYIPFYNAGPWTNYTLELNKEETNILYGIQNDEVNRDMNHGSSSGTVISNLSALAGVSTGCSDVNNIFTFEHNKDLLFASFYNCTTVDLYYTLNARSPTINPITDWHKINLGNGNRSVIDVEIDPLDPNTIYVVLYPDWNGGSIKIVNKVENFTSANPTITDLTYNLPNTTLSRECLIVEKGSNGGMYLATDIGSIFYTNRGLIAAGGTSNAWVQFGSNYPHLTTNGLEINYKVNKIRAAPYSRGVWEADLYCPPAPYICSNCTTVNGNFWEGTYVSVSNSTLNTGKVTMRGTDYVELLPGAGFTLLDASSNASNVYEAYIHGCTAAQGNTFKLKPEIEEYTEPSIDRTAETGSGFSVYPNPNNGIFTIEVAAEGEKDIFIYDMMGNLVFQRKRTSDTTHQINLSALPKGIYVIQVTDGVNSAVKKAILD